MATSVTILGATGSVGASALRLIADHREQFQVHAVVAGKNVEKLVQNAVKVRANHAVLFDESAYNSLKAALAGTGITAAAGMNAVLDICKSPVDVAIAAISGVSGLLPTLTVCNYAKVIGIANKESLVCGGKMLMRTAKNAGNTIVPIDSEHHSLSLLLRSIDIDSVHKLVLTASGGAVRDVQDLRTVTLKQALNHPTWSMGKKITVDSATLMNKGLELIEACILFDVSQEKIEVIIHPQSIVHGMIIRCDGGIVAHLSPTDMRYPLQDALFSLPQNILPPLHLASLVNLSFYQVGNQRFPSINLARQAHNMGHGACITLNAANEVAVDAFLSKKINFLDIFMILQHAMNDYENVNINSVDDVLALDCKVRQNVMKKYKIE